MPNSTDHPPTGPSPAAEARCPKCQGDMETCTCGARLPRATRTAVTR